MIGGRLNEVLRIALGGEFALTTWFVCSVQSSQERMEVILQVTINLHHAVPAFRDIKSPRIWSHRADGFRLSPPRSVLTMHRH